MSTPKPNKQCVKEFRARIKAAGMVRRDIYAHPEDFAAIKTFAKALADKRASRTDLKD